MAEKIEGKGDGVITMCIVSGLFVIGKLVGGNKLIDPRVFDMYMEPLFDKEGKPILGENGQQKAEERIRMRPLPGVPAFCTIGSDVLKYPVISETQNILSLYKRVTTPVEEKRVFVPGMEVNPKLN